jgi:hypothetical protein
MSPSLSLSAVSSYLSPPLCLSLPLPFSLYIYISIYAQESCFSLCEDVSSSEEEEEQDQEGGKEKESSRYSDFVRVVAAYVVILSVM